MIERHFINVDPEIPKPNLLMIGIACVIMYVLRENEMHPWNKINESKSLIGIMVAYIMMEGNYQLKDDKCRATDLYTAFNCRLESHKFRNEWINLTREIDDNRTAGKLNLVKWDINAV